MEPVGFIIYFLASHCSVRNSFLRRSFLISNGEELSLTVGKICTK